MNAPSPDSETTYETVHPMGCLLRVFWMAFGNVLLMAFAASVARSEGYTWNDAAMALTAFALVAARYVDVTRFEGTTVYSKAADMGHVQRYAVLISLSSAALWVLARLAGPGLP